MQNRIKVGLVAVGIAVVLSGAEVLPPDVNAQSRSRLPVLKREQMDENGKKIYDRLASKKAISNTGPGVVAMYTPEIAEHLKAINQYLRFNGVADKGLRELAILVAIREMNQKYQWSGHEGGTQKAGVPQSVIDVVGYNKSTAGIGEKERVVIEVGRQLFREKRLSPELYAQATKLLGTRATIELVWLMGDYAMSGLVLHAVDQHVPVEDGHHVGTLPDLSASMVHSHK